MAHHSLHNTEKAVKLRCLILGILILAAWINPSAAQQELYVGARPLGLAAFTAIADDANAIKWNPAGLTQLSQQELTTMWSNLFNSGIIQSHLGYVQPISTRMAVGADWTTLQFEDGELDYSMNRMHLAAAYRPFDWLSSGLSVKYQSSSTLLDLVDEGGTKRWDGDFGVLVRPFVGVQLAFVLRDAANTWISHTLEGSIDHESISARKAVAGLSYRTPLPDLTVSAETNIQLEDQLRIGGEYEFRSLPAGLQASLRAGFYEDWDTGGRPSWALGGSLGVPVSGYARAIFEYAYLDSPRLPSTHRFALRIPFSVKQTAVSITGFRSDPVFASLYRRYAKRPVVYMTLFNRQDQVIHPQISFAVKGYTLPPQDIPELFGKTEQRFSLPIALPDEILEQPQGGIPVTVEITYPKESRFRPLQKTYSMLVYPKGKVPLGRQEAIRPYVAFITHEDPPVAEFSRKIVERYDEPDEISRILFPDRMASVREDLSVFFQAVQIYESLRSYGFYFRSVDHKDYEEGYFIDTVRYPREILTSGDPGGDFHDWCVLYSALLESLGVATALSDVTDHTFVMFDTGIPTHKAASVGLTNDRYIVWKDMDGRETIWIPIDPPGRLAGEQETDDSFHSAWEIGLRQCRTYQIAQSPETEDRIVVVREAQEGYPPASLAGAPDVTLPNMNQVDSYLTASLQRFYNEWNAYMEEPARQANDKGIAEAIEGRFTEAAERFQEVLENGFGQTLTAAACNNMGNIFLGKGNLDDALKYYATAQKYDPDDDGIQLNLALSRLLGGETQRANALFVELHREYGRDGICQKIEIPPEQEAREQDLALVSKLYQVLDQLDSEQPLDVSISPTDVYNRSRGLYWKRR